MRLKLTPVFYLFIAIFLTQLYFYGRFLSFPLVGEDGASTYSAMIDALRGGFHFSGLFPIMWLEGLGQPNLFSTAIWDPFSWIMYLPFDKSDLFRISWAIRASCLWLFSYLFVTSLFHSRKKLGIIAGFFALLINFNLTSCNTTPLYAGVFNATHAALFPLLLWLFLKSSKQRTWLGLIDIPLFLALVWFFMVYPLGSLIGLCVLFFFCGVYFLCCAERERWGVLRASIRLLVLCGVVLFFPKIGLWHGWSALSAISARNVFGDELYSYGKSLYPPLLWWDPSAPLAVLVVFGLCSFVFFPKAARSLRTILFTLGGIVLISHFLGEARIRFSALERLPRPFYLEFYLPIMYATAGAWFVLSWRRVLQMPERGFGKVYWIASLCLIVYVAHNLFEPKAFYWVLGVFSLLIILNNIKIIRTKIGLHKKIIGRFPPFVLVVILMISAANVWKHHGRIVHPLFKDFLICRSHSLLFCKDEVGLTVNAASSPLVDFLKKELAEEGEYKGRTDYLVVRNDWNSQEEVAIMVEERNSNFNNLRNGLLLRALPFQGIPIGSSYEQAQDILYYLLWTRYLNQEVKAHRSMNVTVLESADLRKLALLGYRFVVVRDDTHPNLKLRRVMGWSGYSIYELDKSNLKGWDMSLVDYGRDLSDELDKMRSKDFDPRRKAIISESLRPKFENQTSLAPIESSRLRIQKQSILFEAKNKVGTSLVIFPFKYSKCWQPRWRDGTTGDVIRADLGLIGIKFENRVSVELEWTAGYGSLDCLFKDALLIPEAKLAAKKFP